MLTRRIISLLILICSIGFPFSANASLPEIPFSGSSGATVGAGSIVGWERNGFDINPATLETRTANFSISGYSPFGLDGIDVGEANASRDGIRSGTSLSYRGIYDDEGGSASAYQLQESVLLFKGLTTGLSLRYQNDGTQQSFDGGAGMLWKMFSFFTIGGMVETLPMPWGRTLNTGIGVDVGGTVYKAYAWRFCAENNDNIAEGSTWRYGVSLQLHSMLSLYGGWSPAAQTMALGIRFGMGNWEGFSAIRRHVTLGTTSIQGLHWQKTIAP